MEQQKPLTADSVGTQKVQSPVAAFERFVEIVRRSRGLTDVKPDDLLALLRPFLANPHRDEAPVLEIAKAAAIATIGGMLASIPIIGRKFRRSFGPMERFAPDYMLRLAELEGLLKNSLKPGSVTLYVMPVRFLDAPAGFDVPKNRYRLQVQTLIDPSSDDDIEAVSIDLRVSATMGDVVFEEIAPSAAFSSVIRKRSAAAQAGLVRSLSESHALNADVGVAGAKLSRRSESVTRDEESVTFSSGQEHTTSAVEQYLVARKAANRAIWRIVAGIGPIDPAGQEYSVDFLASKDTREIDLEVDVRIEWRRVGVVPAELRQHLSLPLSP